MFHILVLFLLSFPYIARSQFTSFEKLYFPSGAGGPEAVAFDLLGKAYTGISDGRIVRYDELTGRFENFAFTSPNRSDALCNGINNPALGRGPTCGRALGLGFYYPTGEMFIVDAYQGLLVVGPLGGLARQLVNSAEGIPFRSLNGMDVNQLNKDVYFTEGSTKFTLRELSKAVATNDSTGRLLKYNSVSGRVEVVVRDLAGASGISLSEDGSFVLVAEYIGSRIRKHYLRGPKANTTEILVNLAGMPHNIKRTFNDEFWVALSIRGDPAAIRMNQFGNIEETVNLIRYYNNTGISEFQQRGRRFYVGSSDPEVNFLGILS